MNRRLKTQIDYVIGEFHYFYLLSRIKCTQGLRCQALSEQGRTTSRDS